jgi:hypothetical protein
MNNIYTIRLLIILNLVSTKLSYSRIILSKNDSEVELNADEIILENENGNELNDKYIYSACGNYPIIRKNSMYLGNPLLVKDEEGNTHSSSHNVHSMSFTILLSDNDSNVNITVYRFTNPAGIQFDGILGNADGLTSHVKYAPGPPIAESSWFAGYAWKVMYVEGCDDSLSMHIGWSFYKIGKAQKDNDKPVFVYLILWSSIDDMTKEGVNLFVGQNNNVRRNSNRTLSKPQPM